MEPPKLLICRNDVTLEKFYDFFKEMRHRKKFCDVTFRIGDYKISAHRIVLAAGIPGLRHALPYRITVPAQTSGLRSGTDSQNGEDEIALHDISPTAFVQLIDFAYDDEVRVTMEDMKNLLYAASLLKVQEVIDACCDFLIKRMNVENLLDIREMADHAKCPDLLAITHYHIRRNFDKLSDKENILHLPFPRLKEIIGSDDLRVSSEEKVFETVIKWAKVSPEDRKDDLPELLKEVRLPLLSLLYIKNHVAEEHLIKTSVPCRDLLNEIWYYYLFPEDGPRFVNLKSEPRPSSYDSKGIAFASEPRIYAMGSASTFTSQYFCSKENKWKMRKKLLHDCSSTCAEVDNMIFIFVRCDIIRFCPVLNKYCYTGKTPTFRPFTEAVALEKKIYLCGGLLNGSPTNIVECYNPKNRKWTEITPMLECRKSPAAVVLGDSIYILGGQGNSVCHKSAEKYDSEAKMWTPISSMLTERTAPGSAVLNYRIYVCGGETADSKCTATAEVYDPVEDRWKFVSPMKIARSHLKLLPYYGKFYALGGYWNKRPALIVEIYDPETNTWEFGENTDPDAEVSGAVVTAFPVP